MKLLNGTFLNFSNYKLSSLFYSKFFFFRFSTRSKEQILCFFEQRLQLMSYCWLMNQNNIFYPASAMLSGPGQGGQIDGFPGWGGSVAEPGLITKERNRSSWVNLGSILNERHHLRINKRRMLKEKTNLMSPSLLSWNAVIMPGHHLMIVRYLKWPQTFFCVNLLIPACWFLSVSGSASTCMDRGETPCSIIHMRSVSQTFVSLLRRSGDQTFAF